MASRIPLRHILPVLLIPLILLTACSEDPPSETEQLGETTPDMPAEMVPDTGADATPDRQLDREAGAHEDLLEERACNGLSVLCDRPLDDVFFASTHNAMSNAEDNWVAPNQNFGIPRQLEDGVRAFMLDLYYYFDEPYLCHSLCEVGRLPLVDGFTHYTSFLEEHPDNVLVFILETYISAEDTLMALEESGLYDHVYQGDTDGSWPSLGELIDSNQQVIIFTDGETGEYPWLLDVWEYCFETDWHNYTLEEFTCDPNRGNPDNDLFILNHFLYYASGEWDFASEELAATINTAEILFERIAQCTEERGTTPNFINLDFYSTGDLIEVVEQLNSQE